MTKKDETLLQTLARKQGFETLAPEELKELSRLAAKKAAELQKGRAPQGRKKK